jgi:integrase
MRGKGSVYRRCGCRNEQTGTPWGTLCPLLSDPDHGSWYFAIDLPRRNDGCDRHRVRRGGYATRDAAQVALNELRRPDARADAPHSISTGAWLRTWLASCISLAPLTEHGYRTHVRLYLEPALGHIPLNDLRRNHVQDMLTRLAHRGAAGQPLSPNTLTRIRATLRAAMNAAIRDGLIENNPATHLHLPRARRPRAVIWTEHQINLWHRTGIRPKVAVWTATQTAKFLHSAYDHRLYAAFHLVALRGLRRAEAAGLRWCDIDFDNRILQITHTTQRVNGKLMHCPPKTDTSYRTVALDRTTIKELRRHEQRQNAEATARGAEPSGFVFTNRRGQPLNPDHLYREFTKAIAVAGLPPIRLHDLRHGAASLALEAGNDLKVIQDKLGHSSIVLTADTYVSVEPSLARREADTTAQLVLDAARHLPHTHQHPRRRTTPKRRTATGQRTNRTL